MRWLILTEHLHGGAAIAAVRQAEALRSVGVDVDIAAGWKSQLRHDWSPDSIRVPWWVTPKMDLEAPDALAHNYYHHFADLSQRPFLSFWPQLRAGDEALLRRLESYDVVNLHWQGGSFSYWLLEQVSDKATVVVTCHDFNAFTGGCHYPGKCREFTRDCSGCPLMHDDPWNLVSRTLESKINLWSRAQPLWQFPSDWLHQQFQESRVGTVSSSSVTIPNGVPAEPAATLRSRSRSSLRRTLGLDDEVPVVLLGASDLHDPRKGIGDLPLWMKGLGEAGVECQVLTYGFGEIAFADDYGVVHHRHLGTLPANEVLEYMRAADLLLVPSREDNLPNTIVEALSVGTPVLAYAVGGIPELIENGVNGLLADPGDVEGFGEALVGLVSGNVRPLQDGAEQGADGFCQRHDYEQWADNLLEAVAQHERAERPSTAGESVKEQRSFGDSVAASPSESFPMLPSSLCLRPTRREIRQDADPLGWLAVESAFITTAYAEFEELDDEPVIWLGRESVVTWIPEVDSIGHRNEQHWLVIPHMPVGHDLQHARAVSETVFSGGGRPMLVRNCRNDDRAFLVVPLQVKEYQEGQLAVTCPAESVSNPNDARHLGLLAGRPFVVGSANGKLGKCPGVETLTVLEAALWREDFCLGCSSARPKFGTTARIGV